MTQIEITADCQGWVETEHRGRGIRTEFTTSMEAAQAIAELQYQVLDLKRELADAWQRA